MERYKGLKEPTDFAKERNQRINTIWFQNDCVMQIPHSNQGSVYSIGPKTDKQVNGKESPETDTKTYGQLIFGKDVKVI